MSDRTRYDQGLEVRRAVLGDVWVDQSLAARTPLDSAFQDLITRYAWGEIWTRPGLSHETRRLLVLAMTIALNREHEFRLHLRAALDAGMSAETIEEVLLQSAIYCGVPAALTAFNWAKDVIAQRNAATSREGAKSK